MCCVLNFFLSEPYIIDSTCRDINATMIVQAFRILENLREYSRIRSSPWKKNLGFGSGDGKQAQCDQESDDQHAISFVPNISIKFLHNVAH